MLEFGNRIATVSYADRPGAYAVIRDKSNSVALVKTNKGYFLPGGGVEPEEDLETALQREILEETGYAVKVREEFATAAQYLYAKSDGACFRKVGHFFLASLTEKISEPTETDHELVWCSVDESLRKLAHDFQKWAVRQALHAAP